MKFQKVHVSVWVPFVLVLMLQACRLVASGSLCQYSCPLSRLDIIAISGITGAALRRGQAPRVGEMVDSLNTSHGCQELHIGRSVLSMFVRAYALHCLYAIVIAFSLFMLYFCLFVCVYRLVGLVVKASALRAAGPGFDSRFRRNFCGSSHTSNSKILQWLPCQAPGVIESALGLAGPVSVICDWVRWKV